MNRRSSQSLVAAVVAWTPLVTAAAVGMITALVLIGWALDIEAFKSFLHPRRIAMNPASAVSLLIGAASVWGMSTKSPSRRLSRGARVGGVVILCITLAKLSDYTLGTNFQIDQILFRSQLQNNIMAPNTAIALAMIGLGIFLIELRIGKQFHPAQGAIIAGGCIGLLSITGYAYQSDELYEVHGFIPMALNSAISIVLLSVGLLCTRPTRQPLASILSDTFGGLVARRLVPAAFLVPLILGRLQILGTKFGLYQPSFGLAVLVIMHIIVFNVLIWWCANAMRTTDLRRRETEQALRDSDERHRAILEQAAEGIYLVDLETKRVIDFNPAMERLLGYAHGEAEGKLLYTFIGDTRENIDARINKLANVGEPLYGERKYRRKDGMTIDVEASATAIEYGGRRVVCTVAHDVTDRNRAEAMLRRNETRLRLIIETANDAFVAIDAAGTIIDWNAQATTTFGWSPEQAVGRKVSGTLIPERLFQSNEKGLKSFLATGVGSLVGQRVELVGMHCNGREFPIEITIAPVGTGDEQVFFAFIHDISVRKHAEEERERFFTLSSDIVAVADFDGYFKRVNPAFESITGYTAEELCAHPYTYFVHPDDRASTNSETAKLNKGQKVFQFENRYRCKDGSYKWISWMSAPVVSERLTYAIAHDMTERKLAEKKLEEAARLQREAYQQLKETQSQLVQSEKLAGLGQMVAGVAHEINNPLSFVANNVAVVQRDIQSLTQLLALYSRADTMLENHNAELLNEIRALGERVDMAYTKKNLNDLLIRSRDGLRRIQQIVKDLRDFARLDESDLHEVDLNAGIQSTINIVAGKAKKKRVQIDMELSGLPFVTCFPAKINQVVMNLVSNAIDAAPEGGRILVQSGREKERVQITVSDNGPGVPQNIRGRIFDPFFTTKPVGEGTGLGLSISYGIIHDHHGTIEVSDAPGGGALFRISIPHQIAGKPTAAAIT